MVESATLRDDVELASLEPNDTALVAIVSCSSVARFRVATCMLADGEHASSRTNNKRDHCVLFVASDECRRPHRTARLRGETSKRGVFVGLPDIASCGAKA